MTTGIVNLAKPGGISSRAAVDRVARCAGTRRAGHAGTLDPLATGVLVVCLGRATRLVEYVQRLPKEYVATFVLGQSSPTDDTTGEVTVVAGTSRPAAAEVRAALAQFVGAIEQVPPAYSALKVEGRRAYELARRGDAVELAARPVDVYSIVVERYEYPELALRIRCGSGTYVRALGRDLARALGTEGVMSALTRTAIGSFSLADACPVDALAPESFSQWLLPIERGVEALGRIELTDEQLDRIGKGQAIALAAEQQAAELAAFDRQGKLRAILMRKVDGSWKPAKNDLHVD
jgi:tRNA pseudouridine55 synthase